MENIAEQKKEKVLTAGTILALVLLAVGLALVIAGGNPARDLAEWANGAIGIPLTGAQIIFACLFLVVGLVLIVKGGDAFVDAATWIAEISGIPKFIIGATVVSLATTLPELLTSAFAAAQGSTDMAIGNAVGSVTANIALIMAISLLAMPAVIRRKDYAVKVTLMLGSAAIIVGFGLTGNLGWVPSILLIVLFGINVWENLVSAKKSMEISAATQEEKPAKDKATVILNLLKFVLGAAAIVVGARLLVDNGCELAHIFEVDERIISVTIIAVGTSLPELVTTITAVIKKQEDLSVGNIIGANIIDLTLILPISMFISGEALPVSQAIKMVDFPACLLVGVVACAPALICKRFRRWQGAALLLLYAAYLTVTIAFF